MSFQTQIDVARCLVLIRFSGAATVDDFVRGRAELIALPGWSPGFAHVFDFIAVEKLELPTEALRKMASAPPAFAKDALQILVAVPGTVQFGLARMFQSHAARERPNVVIASSLAEAYEIVRNRCAPT